MMGTEAKPYDRVHFVLFVFKSPRSGTANLFANGCKSHKKGPPLQGSRCFGQGLSVTSKIKQETAEAGR
jgi:hypothetical protein